MAESNSESEPSRPSHLNLIQILDIFNSAGYVDTNRNEFSDFDKLVGGLSWCISICSNGTLKIDTIDDIVDALKTMGCPQALQANQIKDLDCVSIYPAVQWLVSRVKTKQKKNEYVNRRKTAVMNELQLVRERIDEACIDSTVQKLASLLKTSKTLERQASNFQLECNEQHLGLVSEITELEKKLSNGVDDEHLCDDLDRSIYDLSATLKHAKKKLASKLRESVSLKWQLDDVPIAEEVVQYEHRFSELNAHIQDRLQRTRRYYATYNALLEIKDLMTKEISLLNSFDSQFQDAIRNPAGRTKLIDSIEAILRGAQQKLEKVQPGFQAECKTFDALREQYTAAIANQRCCAELSKAFQEEIKRNEKLKEECARKESSRCHSLS